VLKNDSTYNLAPSFLRFPQIIPVTIDELRKHALDDTPYLNGTPEGMPAPIELDLRNMCTLIAKHEFRTYVHEKSMFPIRFALPTKIIIENLEYALYDNDPLVVSYGPTCMNTTLRSSVSFNTMKLYVCSISDRLIRNTPDTAIGRLSSCAAYWIERSVIPDFVIDFDSWLSRAMTYFNEIPVAVTTVPMYTSLFNYVKRDLDVAGRDKAVQHISSLKRW
jgi:hypothetical protein